MSIVLRYNGIIPKIRVCSRAFCCGFVLNMKDWRVEKGLPVNRNAEGVLTDTPDFTYLDGRPTPILHKQRKRMKMQEGYALKMIELCSELQFAKDRYEQMENAKEQERQQIIANRLKPKGQAMLQRKKK